MRPPKEKGSNAAGDGSSETGVAKVAASDAEPLSTEEAELAAWIGDPDTFDFSKEVRADEDQKPATVPKKPPSPYRPHPATSEKRRALFDIIKDRGLDGAKTGSAQSSPPQLDDMEVPAGAEKTVSEDRAPEIDGPDLTRERRSVSHKTARLKSPSLIMASAARNASSRSRTRRSGGSRSESDRSGERRSRLLVPLGALAVLASVVAGVALLPDGATDASDLVGGPQPTATMLAEAPVAGVPAAAAPAAPAPVTEDVALDSNAPALPAPVDATEQQALAPPLRDVTDMPPRMDRSAVLAIAIPAEDPGPSTLAAAAVPAIMRNPITADSVPADAIQPPSTPDDLPFISVADTDLAGADGVNPGDAFLQAPVLPRLTPDPLRSGGAIVPDLPTPVQVTTGLAVLTPVSAEDAPPKPRVRMAQISAPASDQSARSEQFDAWSEVAKSGARSAQVAFRAESYQTAQPRPKPSEPIASTEPEAPASGASVPDHASPSERIWSFADGTEIAAAYDGKSWTTAVVASAATDRPGQLRRGDILVRDFLIRSTLDGASSFSELLDLAKTSGETEIDFAVIRGGKIGTGSLTIAGAN